MRLVSVHETGHALVAAFNPDHEPVNKITVVPRSHGVGGFTQYREEGEEKFNMTRKDMMDEIDSLLGGRAAEQIILGDISTGASNDIARATDILKRMITDFGMSDKFKNMTLGSYPKYIAELEGMGVKMMPTIADLLKEVDVVLLETCDGRPHYAQALEVFKSGKRVFIDKPVAASLADAIKIDEAVY